MISCTQYTGCCPSGSNCTYRNSASQSLCRNHNVGSNVVQLIRKHISASAHTTLNLIQNHQNFVLIAKLSDSFDKVLSGRINSALTLYCFHKNCTGIFCNQAFNAVQIIEIGKFNMSKHRSKRFLIGCFPCYG